MKHTNIVAPNDVRQRVISRTQHDAPVYDVADRVRMLNEQLAKQNASTKEVRSPRRRSIKFKETLVDLEVPPPPQTPPGYRVDSDYGDSDEDEEGEGVLFLNRDGDSSGGYQPSLATTTTTGDDGDAGGGANGGRSGGSRLVAPPSCDGFDSDSSAAVDSEAPYETKGAKAAGGGDEAPPHQTPQPPPPPYSTAVYDEVDHTPPAPPPPPPPPSSSSYTPSTSSSSPPARPPSHGGGGAGRPKTAPHRRSVEFEHTPRRLEEKQMQEKPGSSSAGKVCYVYVGNL